MQRSLFLLLFFLSLASGRHAIIVTARVAAPVPVCCGSHCRLLIFPVVFLAVPEGLDQALEMVVGMRNALDLFDRKTRIDDYPTPDTLEIFAFCIDVLIVDWV